eukprot:TRINITY_DN1042_c0_g1_i1.p1 TRINITY_DN1042_c0_g1~~TRINITY_DN1042_c0_g1_i1.p1  ORF type:complete len:112 (+),score=31.53 TRINITY_DN1042_c0_g1_i1:109-444(+)
MASEKVLSFFQVFQDESQFETLQKIFDTYDLDSNKALDVNELPAFLFEVCLGLMPGKDEEYTDDDFKECAKSIVEIADANKSGDVSIEELKNAINTLKSQAAAAAAEAPSS